MESLSGARVFVRGSALAASLVALVAVVTSQLTGIEAQVQPPPSALYDLAVTQDAPLIANTSDVGTLVYYTLHAQKSGSGEPDAVVFDRFAPGLDFDAALSSGVCTKLPGDLRVVMCSPDLTSGQPAKIELVFKPNVAIQCNVPALNAATIMDQFTQDGDFSNNHSEVSAYVCPPTFSGSISGPADVVPGEEVTFTVTETNTSTFPVTHVAIQPYYLSSLMEFVSGISGDGTACLRDGNGNVSCNVAMMAPGATTTATLTFRISATVDCSSPPIHLGFYIFANRNYFHVSGGDAYVQLRCHSECNSSHQCVAVPGSGPDLCMTDADCTPTHLICEDEQCMLAPGAGPNQCATDTDCTSHAECNSSHQCVAVPGSGPDLCMTDADCTPTHLICEDEQCMLAPGAGPNQCQTDAQCADTTVPGLVAHWRFEESSGTVVQDSAGDADGYLTGGASRVAGRYGNGVRINAGKVSIPSPSAPSININGPMSFSFWAKGTWNGANYPRTIQKGHLGGQVGYGCAWSGNQKVDCWYRRPNGQETVQGMTLPSANVWHMVTVTWDGTQLRIYRDGTDATSPSGAQGYATSGDELSIGNRPGNFSQGFAGVIDDVRIYNRALSAGEAASLYSEAS